MTQEAAPRACVARECRDGSRCRLTSRFLAFSASLPPTRPATAISPTAMWQQSRVLLPRSAVRALMHPAQPLGHLAERVDQSQLPRPALEEGSVLYRRSVTTDLLPLPRRPRLPSLPLSEALPAGPRERSQLLALLPNEEPAN